MAPAIARQLASSYRIDLRVVVPTSSPLAGFFASSGYDRLLAIYPTLRGALTAPRESGAGRRPASEPPDGRAEAASGAG